MGAAVQRGECGMCRHDFMSGLKIRVWWVQHGYGGVAWWVWHVLLRFGEQTEHCGLVHTV